MRKTLYLLLLIQLFILPSAMAQTLQKFSVAGFEEKPFDTSARDPRYEVRDGNGERFSIVKVVSTDNDDDLSAYSFDFGLCEHRVKEVDGELWLYVQRNAMHVTIKRAGYSTVKHELKTTVQTGKVYEMVLNPVPVVVKKRMVQFEVTPASSRAQISYIADGKKGDYEVFGDGLIDEEGMAADKLELGTYTYKIISKNYHPSEGRIILTDANTTHIERVTLRPNYGKVALTAVDAADIYIDGGKVGTGSWNGTLKPGTYNVECRMKNHKNSLDVIMVKEGEDKKVTLTAPTPITGSLSLLSSPLGASITIDGKDFGKTAADISGLLVGEHTVVLSKTGYETVTFTVNIMENKTIDHKAVLNKVSKKDELVKTAPEAKKKETENKVLASKKKETEKNTEKTKVVKPSASDAGKAADASKSKYRYGKKFSAYAEATGSYVSSGYYGGLGLNLGLCFTYFNIEGYTDFGLATCKLSDYNKLNYYKVKPMNFGGRVGATIPIGKRLALTPQVGVGVLCVKGDEINATAMNITGGLRCEFMLAKYIGISLTPEYKFNVSKSDAMNLLSSFSPTVEGWAKSGLNLRLGVHFNF